MTIAVSQETERDARDLHAQSIFVNALDCTPLAQGDALYLQKLLASGVTMVIHAVSVSDGPEGGLKGIADWRGRYRELGGKLMLGRTVADVEEAKRTGRIAMFLNFEDSAQLGGQLWMLETYWELGLRVLGLTYQYRNLAGDGSGEPANGGLSKYGRALVEECNRLGMVLDLSHTGERSTLETIECSRQPVLVTHAGLRHFVDSPRNKSDAEVRALAARGGVIGIAAKSGFLSPTGLREGTDVGTYVDNVAYVADLVGVDHVAVGTDLGDARKYTRESMALVRKKYPEIPIIGDDLNLEIVHPRGLADIDELANVTPALLARGFSREDTQKVLGGNILRVMREVIGA